MERINHRLGYRLQLLEAAWPAEVAVHAALPFRHLWRNAGVAPCLPGGYPAVTLKDDKGGIAAVFTDESFNVLSVPPGAPDQAEPRGHEPAFTLPPILKPGVYQVYISIGTRTGTPRIALPLANEDGGRRYRLGVLKVVAK